MKTFLWINLCLIKFGPVPESKIKFNGCPLNGLVNWMIGNSLFWLSLTYLLNTTELNCSLQGAQYPWFPVLCPNFGDVFLRYSIVHIGSFIKIFNYMSRFFTIVTRICVWVREGFLYNLSFLRRIVSWSTFARFWKLLLGL